MAAKTLLNALRSTSKVDCDTLDVKVAETLGPFVDCTSNQAIALKELKKPEHESLIKESIILSRQMKKNMQINIDGAELAVEIMMVRLSMRMVPYLTGYVHTQTNPYNSFSREKTIENAQRIVHIYQTVDPRFDKSRICIKIPSTWEGLQACAALEKVGIATLATTLFSMEQAAAAAEAKCTYIAPYVNELKVHFEAGYVDTDKGFDVCRLAQRYYSRIGARTQVLPASLVSTDEVMKLRGAHHITVSAPLLAELARTPADPSMPDDVAPFMEQEDGESVGAYEGVGRDEAAFRMACVRSKAGATEAKLTQAINIFCDMQDKLEELARDASSLL